MNDEDDTFRLLKRSDWDTVRNAVMEMAGIFAGSSTYAARRCEIIYKHGWTWNEYVERKDRLGRGSI